MNSKKNSDCMSIPTLELSLKNLKPVLKEDTFIGLSGGEPMLYEYCDNDISDVIKLLMQNGFKNIDIQTSGWDENDEFYQKRFEKIKTVKSECNLNISTSYNLYQKEGINSRMINTLPQIMGLGIIPFVHMVVDLSNIVKSFNEFYRLAHKIGLKSDVTVHDIIEGLKKRNGDVIFQKIKFNGEFGQLILGASALQRVGRAKKMKAKTMKSLGLCNFLQGKENSINIYPDGEIKACRIPQSIYMPSIGNIKESSLADILSNRTKLRSELLSYVESTSDTMPICDKCSEFSFSYN